VSNEELLVENRAQKLQILELKNQLAELKRLVFGRKSERFIPAQNLADQQGNLFSKLNIENTTSEKKEPQAEQVVVPAHTRKKSNHKGRTLLAKLSHLPVQETEIFVPHSENSQYIGQVERNTLAYTPGKFYINKEVIKKYKDSESGDITNVQFPAHPIPKCEAHITLLVYICIAKFVDHLPEYRQQKIFKRDGIIIPPSTMNGWIHKCAELLKPMADLIGQCILASQNIMIDESSIKVMDGKKNRTHTGWMWAIYSPALSLVQFIYHQGRTHDIPIKLLKDYSGNYQSDGYKCYDTLDDVNANAVHSQCNAHARRNFEKALNNDKHRAEHALQVYQELYKVEQEIRDYRVKHEQLSLEQYYIYRTEKRNTLVPVLEKYKLWLEEQQYNVVPKSAIGKAIAYTLKRWKKLTLYINDGALEIDNNLIENTIRPLALGRKNYLFAGNHEAAENIAAFYTIFNTCRHCNINPSDYLTWYLTNVPNTKINQLYTLTPNAYKEKVINN